MNKQRGLLLKIKEKKGSCLLKNRFRLRTKDNLERSRGSRYDAKERKDRVLLQVREKARVAKGRKCGQCMSKKGWGDFLIGHGTWGGHGCKEKKKQA